jgi:MFS family permease
MPPAPARGFLGWRVVGASFAVLTLIFGACYGFPAFFDPLAREFPGSRGNIALVFGLAGGLFFLVGAVAGPLADRHGSRRVVAAGVVLVGLGLIGASFGRTLWEVLLAFGLGVGLGVGFGYVPAVAPVQRWFHRRRGRASGFAVAGIGVGTFGGPLLAAAIMGWSDWRTAWLAIGIGVVVLGLGAAYFLIDSPDRVGQRPDGTPPDGTPPDGDMPAASGPAPAPTPTGYSVKGALGTRPFWLLYAAAGAMSLPLFVPFVHLVPYAMDRGIGKSTAVLIAACIGIGSILGRFGLGALADRLGRRPSLVACFVGLTLMYLLWIAADQAWLLAVFAVIYGTCYGGFVALVPAVTVDYLGTRAAGGIIGALYTGVGPGTLIGPPLAGWVFDAAGSYTWPLVAGAAFMALATVIVALLPDPTRWRASRKPTS